MIPIAIVLTILAGVLLAIPAFSFHLYAGLAVCALAVVFVVALATKLKGDKSKEDADAKADSPASDAVGSIGYVAMKIIFGLFAILLVTAVVIGIFMGLAKVGQLAFADSRGCESQATMFANGQDKMDDKVLFSGTLEPGKIYQLHQITASPNKRLYYHLQGLKRPVKIRVFAGQDSTWSTYLPTQAGQTWSFRKSGRIQIYVPGKEPVSLSMVQELY